MPQPHFGDIRRFCEIDGWEETKTARGKTGDHYRYRQVLDDGTILRTRASHGNDQIRDPSLWRRIWRNQLGLKSEDEFWDTLRSGKPVDRSQSPPAKPSGPSLPGWLFDALIRVAGIPENEVRQLSEDEAKARLNEFYSRPRTGLEGESGSSPCR